jgi:hypothetical protein
MAEVVVAGGGRWWSVVVVGGGGPARRVASERVVALRALPNLFAGGLVAAGGHNNAVLLGSWTHTRALEAPGSLGVRSDADR